MKKPITHVKVFFFLISAFSMLFGGIIYLIWRPPTLLMFSWCRSLGIYGGVQHLRSTFCGIKEFLPAWFIYSLPQALWCFSGLCSIHAIWINKNDFHEQVWIIIILIMSLLTEILQLFNVIPGTCDIIDLVLIIVIYILFELIIMTFNVEITKRSHQQIKSYYSH